MARPCRPPWVGLSLASGAALFLAAPAWSGSGSDRLLARADRLITQTSRLLVEVDRLMARDTRPSTDAASDAGSTEPEVRAGGQDPGAAPAAGAARKAPSLQTAVPPAWRPSDGSSDVGRRSATPPAHSMPGARQVNPVPALADYREMGERLDRRLARADELIARTAHLMEKADRVIAQAAPPAESDAPAPGAPQSTAPPPSEGEAPKEQPAPTGETKPPADTQPNGATTTQPALPSPDQPASKEKPAAAGAPKEPTSGAAPQQEEEREVARVPLAAVQAGGLLLPKDSLIVEPTVFYTYSQNTRLIVTGFSVLPLIILGTFESERIVNNLVSPALQLRYGLFRGAQLDFRIPYTYADQSRIRLSTEQAGQIEESQHDAGIGDISFGLTYQFLYERGWLPDLMVRIGASAPTGKSQFDIFREIAQGGGLASAEAFLAALNSKGIALGAGRWNIQTAVNGIKALDPGILFATIGWNYTPESDEDLIQVTATTVTGGIVLQPQLVSSRLGAVHSLSASLGLAISLNNQLSVNFSVSELINKSTTANGFKIPGSATNIGLFNFGMNLAVSPTTTLNFVSSFGITPDAPNLTLLMSVPVFYNNVAENAYGYLKSTIGGFFRRKPAPIEKPKEEKPKEEKPKEEKPKEEKPAEKPKG